MCRGPFRGTPVTQQVAKQQWTGLKKGPHGLEAWRSGIMTTADLRYHVLNREAKRRLIPRLPNTSPKVPFGLGGWGAGGWVLLGFFFHNKQDCGGNALSHSIALPLAIDHPHHHIFNTYRYAAYLVQ